MQTKKCYVNICFYLKIKESSSSNKIKSQESYFSNQDTLRSLKEIQRQIKNFDKSLKTMWHGRDAKSRQHVLFIYLFICFYYFFFSILVFFYNHSRITGLQGNGEGISLTPHYHFHSLYRHLVISRAITAESSPLHIGSSRFPSASC